MKTMVELPDGNWVNPAHVTSIELCKYSSGNSDTKIWVRKNSGYGTGAFTFKGDVRKQLAAIVNGDTDAPLKNEPQKP